MCVIPFQYTQLFPAFSCQLPKHVPTRKNSCPNAIMQKNMSKQAWTAEGGCERNPHKHPSFLLHAYRIVLLSNTRHVFQLDGCFVCGINVNTYIYIRMCVYTWKHYVYEKGTRKCFWYPRMIRKRISGKIMVGKIQLKVVYLHANMRNRQDITVFFCRIDYSIRLFVGFYIELYWQVVWKWHKRFEG